MSNRFTQYILAAMVLGIVMGAAIYNFLPDTRAEWASSINLIAMMFLRLIKMIIAPLVFATLVGGIAHMGSGSRLGRIFAKTMGWFVSASFVSLLLGLIMVNLLQPGANFPGTLPDKGQSTGLPVSAFSIEKFLTHLIPTSIADAMAQNEILQIVVFAVFFAVALGAMPERAKPIMQLIDDLAHIMLKVTGYVMLFAPIAVWAAIMATVSKNGLGVLWKLIQFMGGFYLELAMLATLMITSKGVAGVPRASLVVIASTLSQFGIPEAGLLMIMGIDTFLDMGRSATNVIGNSLATAVVAKWEGELAPVDASGPDEELIPASVPAMQTGH